MKWKAVAALTVAMAFIAGSSALYSKRHTFFPSAQMKSLRQLETQLDLPKPRYRHEEDVGFHRDGKGAPHYDRHIALSYKDVSLLDALRDKLLTDSWQEQPQKTLGSFHYFSFRKGIGAATRCVHGFTAPADTDGITLYIALSASGEYTCNPAPGT